jgi:uncharacterized protein YndB with AHSA1/START domain
MTTTQIGKLAVRRSIEIKAPPGRVWREFESAERFRLWYSTAGGVDMPCKGMKYEPRVAGAFDTRGWGEWQGARHDFHWSGTVVVYDPPRELTVEFRRAGDDSGVALLLSWFLTPIAGSRTHVELVQHGFERLGEAAQSICAMYEGGWDMTVPTALRNLVETGRATG